MDTKALNKISFLIFLPLFTIITGCSFVGNDKQSVRAAAIQCYSRMGEIEHNRELLTGLIEEAAKKGARIVVTPECAVSGYMDPGNRIIWTSEKPDENKLAVQDIAEPVPGPSTEYFSKVAARNKIYLCVGIIEEDNGEYYNAQVLFHPEGRIIGHHRKRNLWTTGDGKWASEGDLPIQVVETPLGKIGLMICYDFHLLSEMMGKSRVDIVLYSVGWYGSDTETWFKSTFPLKYVVPNHFSIVVSNWSAEYDNPGWPGQGYSCVIDKQGNVLNMAGTTTGFEVVIADIPLRKQE